MKTWFCVVLIHINSVFSSQFTHVIMSLNRLDVAILFTYRFKKKLFSHLCIARRPKLHFVVARTRVRLAKTKVGTIFHIFAQIHWTDFIHSTFLYPLCSAPQWMLSCYVCSAMGWRRRHRKCQGWMERENVVREKRFNIHGNNMLSIKVEWAYKCSVIDKTLLANEENTLEDFEL